MFHTPPKKKSREATFFVVLTAPGLRFRLRFNRKGGWCRLCRLYATEGMACLPFEEDDGEWYVVGDGVLNGHADCLRRFMLRFDLRYKEQQEKKFRRVKP